MPDTKPPVERIHTQLIKIFRSLLPKITQGGICFGYTALWLQSVLTPSKAYEDDEEADSELEESSAEFVFNDEEQGNFFWRTQEMLKRYIKADGSVDDDKIRSELGDPFQWNDLSIYKELEAELLHRLQEMSGLTQMGRRLNQQTNLGLALKHKHSDYVKSVKRLVTKRFGIELSHDDLGECDTLEELLDFIKEEYIDYLTDMHAMITSLALVHVPDLYSEIYGGASLQQVDTQVTLPFTQSGALTEAEQSISTDRIGMFVTDEKALVQILKDMEAMLDHKTDAEGVHQAFMLSSGNHTIGFYYNPKSKAWAFLDINLLKKGVISPLAFKKEELAKRIISSIHFSAIQKDTKVIFNLKLFSNPRQADLLENLRSIEKSHFENTILKHEMSTVNEQNQGVIFFTFTGADPEALRALIKHGVDFENEHNKQMIILAALSNDPIYMQTLIEEGVDVNQSIHYVNTNFNVEFIGTPMEAALESSNVGVIKTILGAGIAMNAASSHFNQAIETNKKEVLELIQQHEAKSFERYFKDNKEDFFKSVQAAVRRGHVDMLRWLVEKDLLNLNDFIQWRGFAITPDLCISGNPKMLEFFLDEHHADINLEVTVHGENRLQYFSRKENLIMCKALLEHGANPNADSGMLPLSIAVMNNNLKLIELLFEHNVDVNHASDRGRAIEDAVRTQNHAMVKLLLKKGAKVDNLIPELGTTLLMLAIELNDFGMAQLLIDHDKNLIHQPNSERQTPIEWAIMKKDYNTIEWLLKQGADVNQSMKERNLTPLLWSFEQRDAKLLDILLTHQKLDVVSHDKFLAKFTRHAKDLKPYMEKVKRYKKEHPVKKSRNRKGLR